jgi:hypothetical protein
VPEIVPTGACAHAAAAITALSRTPSAVRENCDFDISFPERGEREEREESA